MSETPDSMRLMSERTSLRNTRAASVSGLMDARTCRASHLFASTYSSVECDLEMVYGSARSVMPTSSLALALRPDAAPASVVAHSRISVAFLSIGQGGMIPSRMSLGV